MKKFKLFWIDDDDQCNYPIPMGEYASEKAARQAIPESLAELLGVCTDDEQRQGVLDGRWVVELNTETGHEIVHKEWVDEDVK